MPVHYDPARIRKRFCPAGHDKHIEGVHERHCYKCAKIKRVVRRRHNPSDARHFDNVMGRLKRHLRVRIPAKQERLAQLESELKELLPNESKE